MQLPVIERRYVHRSIDDQVPRCRAIINRKVSIAVNTKNVGIRTFFEPFEHDRLIPHGAGIDEDIEVPSCIEAAVARLTAGEEGGA